MTAAPHSFEDFEQFWPHFLSSHLHASTRWAHVAGLGLGVAGAALAVQRRSAWPLLAGAAAFGALAVGAHPLLEGNTAENFGRPLWAARAVLRLCARTVTGSIEAEVAEIVRARAGEG